MTDQLPTEGAAEAPAAAALADGLAPRALVLALVNPAASALFWLALAGLCLQAALATGLLLADPALAQGVGGGSSGNIEQSLNNVYDFLQTIIMILAGIGFVVAAAWWALAAGNDKRKQQGTTGMVCALGAFFAAALVPDFLAAIAEWTGAKSG